MLSQLVRILSIFLALGVGTAFAQAPNPKPSVPTELRERVQNTYIVTLRDGVSSAQIRATAVQAANANNGLIRHVYTNALNGFSITLPAGAAAALNSLPNVKSVEKDQIAYAFGGPKDQYPCWPFVCPDEGTGGGGGGGSTATYNCSAANANYLDWGVQRIGASNSPHSSEFSGSGSNVNVYVIDTGIDLDHPYLCGNIASWDSSEAHSAFGSTCSAGDTCFADWGDDEGHGTHVAGTIAAQLAGVAPLAKLHAVKVLNSSGSGSYSDVIAGVNWVASKASPSIPVVANMSLGGPTSDTLDAAIASARAQGVIFAVAAGNDGRDAQRFSPARSPDAITVSATKGDASQDCKVADDWPKWSNYGDAVDIAAPGVGIRSTKLGGGTISYSGTSMASPHVAGAIALWLASGLAADGNDADDDLFNEALAAIVSKAELTDGTDGGCWTNTSRKPHSEAFLNVD